MARLLITNVFHDHVWNLKLINQSMLHTNESAEMFTVLTRGTSSIWRCIWTWNVIYVWLDGTVAEVRCTVIVHWSGILSHSSVQFLILFLFYLQVFGNHILLVYSHQFLTTPNFSNINAFVLLLLFCTYVSCVCSFYSLLFSTSMYLILSVIYPFFVKFLLLQRSPAVQKFQCTVVCPNFILLTCHNKTFSHQFKVQFASHFELPSNNKQICIARSVQCLLKFQVQQMSIYETVSSIPLMIYYSPCSFLQPLVPALVISPGSVRHSDGSGDSGISEALDLIAHQSTSKDAFLWEGGVSSADRVR